MLANWYTRKGLVYPVLWVLVLLGYARSLGNGFCFDDWGIVVDNPLISERRWVEMWSSDYWSAVGDHSGLYRPLTMASFALNHLVFGGEAWSYHAANVLLHLCTTSLLHSLVLAWMTPTGAFAAALVFGLHPALSEAVVGVVGRGELLSAFFGLAGLWCLLPPSGRGRVHRAVGLALLAAAPLAKESGICFGLGLAAWGWWFQRGRWRLWAGALGAVASALAAKGLALGQLQPGDIGFIDNPLAYADPVVRGLNSGALLVKYLLLLAFPWPLSADYSYDQIRVIDNLLDGALLLPVLLSITVAWGCWRLSVRSVPLALWLAVSGGALLLVANLFVPGGTIFAERLLYLPALALAAGLGLLLGRLPARTGAWLACGWCLAAIPLVWVRCGDWRDDLSLFRATVKTSPASARSHYSLGEALQRQGDPAGALAEYERALAIYPRYAQAWYNRGAALLALNRGREALAAYRQAVQIRPGFTKALFAVAVLLRELEGDEAALTAFEALLAKDPGHAAGVEAYCAVLLRRGGTARAEQVVARALLTDPGNSDLARIQRLVQSREPGPGTATDRVPPHTP